MNGSAPAPTTFADFVAALAARLDADGADRWQPEDRLDAHHAWDSLTQVEVVDWLEDRAVVLPDGLLGEITTLGDLHHYATSPATARPSVIAPEHRSPVHLAPVQRADEGQLFALFTLGDHLTRYRLRGTTPSPEVFHLQLWERVLAQFAVRLVPGGPVVGLVSAFDADLRNRHVHVAAVAHPEWVGSGAVARAAVEFVDHLFATFDLRKVYAEALAGNLDRFASGIGRWFEVEGRLRDHEYVGGGYEDVVLLATTREAWAARRPGH